MMSDLKEIGKPPIEAEHKKGSEKPKSKIDKDKDFSLTYGFVHDVFDNKFYQEKGEVWGPVTIDQIRMFLSSLYRIDKAEEQDEILVRIQLQAQIHAAVRVAGYKAGVYKDRNNYSYLVTQTHKYIVPKKGDWSLIKKIFVSMFGKVQLPYAYAWLKWAGVVARRHLSTWAIIHYGRSKQLR
jgi:hypothetical protein